ncbi:MAG: T9SS type A sorting domain-containing protein [Bacteroidota bacterium]
MAHIILFLANQIKPIHIKKNSLLLLLALMVGITSRAALGFEFSLFKLNNAVTPSSSFPTGIPYNQSSEVSFTAKFTSLETETFMGYLEAEIIDGIIVTPLAVNPNYTSYWVTSSGNDSYIYLNTKVNLPALNKTGLKIRFYFLNDATNQRQTLVTYDITMSIWNNTASGTQTKLITPSVPTATPSLLTGSTPNGGTGTYTYQWEQKVGAGSWSNAPSPGTNKDYQPPALSQNTSYRRKANSAGVPESISNEITVTIAQAITTNTISPSLSSVVIGARPQIFTGSNAISNVSGSSITYEWRWYVITDPIMPYGSIREYRGVISGATGKDLLAPPTVMEGQFGNIYVRVAKAGSYTHYSNEAIVNVVTSVNYLSNTISPNGRSITNNTSPGAFSGNVPTVQETGSEIPFVYQWQRGTFVVGTNAVDQNWQNISGATAQNYNPGVVNIPANRYFKYRRIVTIPNYSQQSTSNEATIITSLAPPEEESLVTAQPALLLYPNPAESIIQLEIPATVTKQNLQYIILNQAGAIIRQGIAINKKSIPVNDLPRGIYLVRLIDDNNTLISSSQLSIQN